MRVQALTLRTTTHTLLCCTPVHTALQCAVWVCRGVPGDLPGGSPGRLMSGADEQMRRYCQTATESPASAPGLVNGFGLSGSVGASGGDGGSGGSSGKMLAPLTPVARATICAGTFVHI